MFFLHMLLENSISASTFSMLFLCFPLCLLSFVFVFPLCLCVSLSLCLPLFLSSWKRQNISKSKSKLNPSERNLSLASSLPLSCSSSLLFPCFSLFLSHCVHFPLYVQYLYFALYVTMLMISEALGTSAPSVGTWFKDRDRWERDNSTGKRRKGKREGGKVK